jgi:hypothetical protein
MAMTTAKYQASWLVHALQAHRNPLCRPVDRVAGLITALLLTIAIFAIPAAVPFGTMLHKNLSQQASRTAVTSHRVPAVLTSNPQPDVDTTDSSGANAQGTATIQWNTALGPHSTTLDVPLYEQRGQQVMIWTNQSGDLTQAPATATDVMWASLFGATGSLVVMLSGCAALIALTQALALRYGQRTWGREWETMQRSGSWLQR